MASRVAFSGQYPDLKEIDDHYRDLESSLRFYFNSAPLFPKRFLGYSNIDVASDLAQRLDETDLTSSLTVLASIEAAFRIDYQQRAKRRDKSRHPISRDFRALYKRKGEHVSLDEEIFPAWIQHHASERALIGEIRGAFHFRHWIAHGRYWTPKLGRKYEYADVYALAEEAFNSFPLLGE
jgi:hypothetical protein